MLDAYSLRKIAPRILIGVIGINLSIYLCVAAIDITNIIGGGIGSLLRAPFLDANSFTGVEGIQIQGNATNTAVGVVGLGAIGALITGIIVAPGLLAAGALAVLGLLMPLLVTALLLAIAVLVVVVIRYGLLVFLSVISPVAIACFILPGTEKYFRQWWDLFVKTLVVYPIIAVMFALSDILAAIFLQNAASDSNSDAIGLVTLFTAIIAILAPLFMIPFAFKFAGGIIGTAMNTAGRLAGQGSQAVNKSAFMQRRQHNLRNRSIEARSEMAQQFKNRASAQHSGKGRFGVAGARRKMYGTAAKMVGGYNIEARASAVRAEVAKELNDQINTGRDEEIRGLTVNKLQALQEAPGKNWRIENGRRQFKSLGGRWIDEADVDQAHARWGNDTFAQQAALSYEMRKAQTDDELSDLATRYSTVAAKPGGWGMSEDQAGGAWIGAAFENQNQHLEYKYTDWKTGEMDAAKAKGFATEIYEKRGSYPLAQMSGHTFSQLKEAYNVGDEETKKQIRSVAETFVYRGGAVGPQLRPGDEEGKTQPATELPPGANVSLTPAGKTVQTSAQGAASVNAAVRDLAVHVGVYQPDNRPHPESPHDPNLLPPNPQN